MSDLYPFRRFCANLVLENGSRMILEEFEEAILADYFAGATETLVLIPKKNGKSTLLAALGLFHLLVTLDAECIVAAASRDQATILYDQGAGFVRRTPGLLDRLAVKRGYREIRSLLHSGRMRVLAADVDTADGVIPTLGLVDELHRQRSSGLYGVFRDGLGPRNGQMVGISTAGDNEASPLGLMRTDARKLPIVRREGRYTHARSEDGSFVFHEWALDPDDDRSDMAVVKLANPASWQTEAALRRRYASPSMLPSQWARFGCGVWQAGETWWMTSDAWHEVSSSERISDGEVVTLGFDGARYGDSTALVACRVSDGLVEPLDVWESPGAGAAWEVPEGAVDASVADAYERFKVVRGYFDPPLWQSEIDAWAQAYGEPAVLRYWTNRTRMMGAVERFRTDVVAGKVSHTGDATLTAHALAARMVKRQGGYFLAKDAPNSPHKIDAAVAAVLAYEARADAITAGALAPRSGKLVAF